jgi:hypothetical protein
LINIADCEEKLGHLVLAQKHWILARDQAQLQGAETAKNEAEMRLTALEQRMPRLTIKLSEPAGVSAEVRRDGVLLGRVTLGVPLPLDLGSHEVRVTAPGRADQTYNIDAVEGGAQVLDATVGAPLDGATAAAPPDGPATPVTAPAPVPTAPEPEPKASSDAASAALNQSPASASQRDSLWSPQRIAAVSVASAGAVALGAAGYTWWRASAQHQEAQSACSPECTGDARRMQSDAHDNAQLSTILVASGGILLGAGAVFWLTAPTQHTASVALVPVATERDVGLLARGRF